jgi:HSP20 family molecular chaperone IbpA
MSLKNRDACSRGTGAASGSWDVNMDETDKEVVVRAEAPGFEPGEFDIDVRGDMLTIRAEHKETEDQAKEGAARQWGSRRLERSFTLPVTVDPDKVEAHYRNGVLEVHLPRTEQAPPGAGSRSRRKREGTRALTAGTVRGRCPVAGASGLCMSRRWRSGLVFPRTPEAGQQHPRQRAPLPRRLTGRAAWRSAVGERPRRGKGLVAVRRPGLAPGEDAIPAGDSHRDGGLSVRLKESRTAAPSPPRRHAEAWSSRRGLLLRVQADRGAGFLPGAQAERSPVTAAWSRGWKQTAAPSPGRSLREARTPRPVVASVGLGLQFTRLMRRPIIHVINR